MVIMKTWLTADWHLGENRFELMGRPFSGDPIHMVDHIIAEHNALVDCNDRVLMLGDVCYQKAPEFLPWVAKMNGKKILFRGNHDRVFTDEQLAPYFEQIVPEGEGRLYCFGDIACWLTHYPTRGIEEAFNLVGHVHAAWKYQLNMLNVGVDVHHFRPVDSETIPFYKTAIEKFYDQDVWIGYNPINANYQGKRGKTGSYFTPS